VLLMCKLGDLALRGGRSGGEACARAYAVHGLGAAVAAVGGGAESNSKS
jgi:hypothetical protein